MLCRTAKAWHTRPSALLGLSDAYVAYCLDEAGAALMAHKDPPAYGARTPVNRDKDALLALRAHGAKVDL